MSRAGITVKIVIKMLSLLFSLTTSKRKNYSGRQTNKAYKPIEFPERAIVIGKKGLVLYDSMHYTKKAIITIPPGQNVTVIGSYPNNSFYRIKYNETVGYGSSHFLLITTNATVGVNILIAAINKIGCQYTYGMAGPNSFDLAGLIYYAHKAAGVTIPRLAKDMYNKGQIIKRGSAQPGDVLFFPVRRCVTAGITFWSSMAIVTFENFGYVGYVGIQETAVTVGSFIKKRTSYAVRRFW